MGALRKIESRLDRWEHELAASARPPRSVDELSAEVAHRNLLALHAIERRPQAHEQRRGCNEAP